MVKTLDFKIEIGEIIENDKGSFTIIDRRYKDYINKNKKIQKHKIYTCECNNCGYDMLEKTESNLFYGKTGCPVCCKFPRISVLGINTIWDKEKWMCQFMSEQDAKTHTPCSNKKISVHCPYCGKQTEKKIYDIYRRKSLACSCGDGISYPEKFLISVFEQLKIDYIYQLSKTNFTWCQNKRYDFYLPKYNLIIETHGEQHYMNKSHSLFEEQQENDKFKKDLALNNNIDIYIELDCRNSSMDWIKNSIINSVLNKLVNLSNIDWLKCEEDALNNKVKQICNYWKVYNNDNNENLTSTDLEKIFHMSSGNIIKYLKKGTLLGWCNYDPKEENRKSGIKSGISKGKPVEIYKDGKLLGVFESCADAERKSQNILGVQLDSDCISNVANGVAQSTKGYIARYVGDNNIDVTKRIETKNIRNKKIEVLKDGISLGVFENVTQLLDCCKKIFDVNFTRVGIASVISNKQETHRGYSFKYCLNQIV